MAASSPKVRLVDCFPYNGELVAEFRMQHLRDVVDEFVVVEARETHSGKPKEALYIDLNRAAFEPFRDKVTFVVIDAFPPPSQEWLDAVPERFATWMKPGSHESWWREMYQREMAERYVRQRYVAAGAGAEPVLVHVSDADEVPNRVALNYAKTAYDEFTAGPVFMDMAFFYYSFKWQKKMNWQYAFLVNDRYMRGEGARTFNDIRVGVARERILPFGGWHCSYFFSKADLRRKLESFAHRECDREEHKTDAFLAACVGAGRDISDRGPGEDCKHCAVPVSELPPEWDRLQSLLERIQRD